MRPEIAILRSEVLMHFRLLVQQNRVRPKCAYFLVEKQPPRDAVVGVAVAAVAALPRFSQLEYLSSRPSLECFELVDLYFRPFLQRFELVDLSLWLELELLEKVVRSSKMIYGASHSYLAVFVSVRQVIKNSRVEFRLV